MTYKTVPAILLKMVTDGELTTKQAANIRDAHENEKAEWRNRIISAVNEAYTAGQKHDPIAKAGLIDHIIGGGYDI